MFGTRMLAFGAIAALAMTASNDVAAATVYNYVGPTYTTIGAPYGGDVPGAFTTAMRVTGNFTTTAPLAETAGLTDISGQLVDFSFSNGLSPTLTKADAPYLFAFEVDIDGAGLIEAWNIVLQPVNFTTAPTGTFGFNIQTTTLADLGAIWECTYNGGGGCSQFKSENATVFHHDANGWTAPVTNDTTPVPLPAAGWFLMAALGALTALRRRTAG